MPDVSPIWRNIAPMAAPAKSCTLSTIKSFPSPRIPTRMDRAWKSESPAHRGIPHLPKQVPSGGFCARPGHCRLALRILALRIMDLHPRAGHRAGHARRTRHAGQLWRDSAPRPDCVDGSPARPRLPPYCFSSGMDAGSGGRFCRVVRLPGRAGAGTAAGYFASQPILLRKSCRSMSRAW